MKIIVDAMGGDNAPDEIVAGALNSAREMNIEIVLTGRVEEVLRALEKLGFKELPKGVEIVNATEIIDMEDEPASAIRQKKDSSMTVALKLLREGRGDALVSAGSTGALLAGSTLIVKRIKGIRRAALAPYLPNKSGGFILIDCGANTECTPEYLIQFALMGSYHAEDVLKLKSPRVGLLNNGAERSKGTPMHREAYVLLEQAGRDGFIHFVGNIEAKDAIQGACDVLVSDGFSGNILLKSVEGTAVFLMSELKRIFTKNIMTKLAALLIKKQLLDLRSDMDPDKVGGTVLLGITKPVIKAHGSSNAAAIYSAIRQAVHAAESNTAERLAQNLRQLKIGETE